jgi:hypothetical protein
MCGQAQLLPGTLDLLILKRSLSVRRGTVTWALVQIGAGARFESGGLSESAGRSRESLRSGTPGGAATVRERFAAEA